MLNKRTLIGALATIIFIVAGPIAVAGPAFAGSTPVTGTPGLTFSVSNNVATVTGYSGTNTDVVIPDTYTDGTGTYTVTAIPKCIIYFGTTLFEGANGYSRSGLTITMPYAPTVSDQFKAVI